MTSLRWYEADTLGALAPVASADDRKLRDPDGTWWTFTDDGAWYALRAGAWEPAAPPARAEGPATLSPPRAAAEPAEPSAEQKDADVLAFIARSVARIRDAYERSRLTSDAAEGLLEGLFVLDDTGRVWTTGVISGIWYSFHGGRWIASQTQPDPARLVDADRMSAAGLDEAIVAFLSAATQIPEQLIPAWEPPTGAPSVTPPPPPPPPPPPSPSPPAAAWTPTHRAPSLGMQTWERPDATLAPGPSLSAGLPVQMTEERGAWAHIVCSNGWSAWVDARLLEKTP